MKKVISACFLLTLLSSAILGDEFTVADHPIHPVPPIPEHYEDGAQSNSTHSGDVIPQVDPLLGSTVGPSLVSCYQCNSAGYLDGADCTGSSLDKFYGPCPTGDGRLYTRCRIIKQTVQGESRTIRSCASDGVRASGDHCVDRTGTNAIKVSYCECSNTNLPAGIKACNRAPAFVTSQLLTSLVLFIAAWLCIGAV